MFTEVGALGCASMIRAYDYLRASVMVAVVRRVLQNWRWELTRLLSTRGISTKSNITTACKKGRMNCGKMKTLQSSSCLDRC
eukprot:scaffold17964_cov127-Skeletonema_marinoi.AAC.3